jgi:hypothetical protein
VRTLTEQRNFSRQAPEHRVEVAERAALKLKQELSNQLEQREQREAINRRAAQNQRETYDSQRSKLNLRFIDAMKLDPQPAPSLNETKNSGGAMK